MSSSGTTPVPGALVRLSILRVGPWRCRCDVFAAFLDRRVRCARPRRHDGPHVYRTFDEVVSWSAADGG